MARMGSKDRGLFERPKHSGIWWVRYCDVDGVEHREKAGPKGLARKIYEKRKTEVREARYFPPDRRRVVTLAEILDNYGPARGIEGKRAPWGPEYDRRVRERFGGLPAEAVTPADLEAWRDELARDHAPATVNRHLQFLRAVYLRAVRDGKAVSTPTAKVKLLRANNKRDRWLRDDEEARLFKTLPVWLRPLVTVALHTGMRKSELLKLRWVDVSFTAGTIAIRDPKSREDEHVVMNETVRRTLHSLSESRSKVVALKYRLPGKPSGYVFTAPEGGFLSNLNRYWYPALKRAGIEDLHFHDLRHTFGSRAAMSGTDLYTLQNLMRHRSPQMTMRYAHLSRSHLREAVRLLDRWRETEVGAGSGAS